MDINAVDLFCGIGGLTHGFESVGAPVSAGIDVDPDCRYPFEANNDAEFVEADVAELSSDEVASLFSDDAVKILAGCAPCQPFSNLNNGKDSEDMGDWGLLKEFGRLVRDIEPSIVTMENVIEIRNHQVYSRFIDTLFKQGYDISINKVDCTNYGVPQNRKRLVALASKIGDISLIDPTHTTYEDRPTVEKTIGGDTLNSIKPGETDDDDPLHRSQDLAEKNLERIRQSKPGGTWHDWDDDLILDCHKKDSGSTYDSVYGRMEWDAPAPTITTQFYGYGSGRFGHPEQDRAISLREGAMLQTFPKSYSFIKEDQEEVHFKQIGRFIGNAVPVRLAEAVGESINQHLEEHNVKDRNASRDGQGNAVSDVAQPQRVESPGAESL
jgi:DNA (cytosine-5)-methyltransferase 1